MASLWTLTRAVARRPRSNRGRVVWYTARSEGRVAEDVRGIMRKMPQPVVVVTTASDSVPKHRRGITVSSFTSICLHPEPLVSFCVKIPSRASDLLHQSGSMVLNMLSHNQVNQSVAFASPAADQFKDVPFYDDHASGLPVLMGTVGAMHCERKQVLPLGDHELWIAKVRRVQEGIGLAAATQPLLYYDRCYRSVGEQVFMEAFEDCSLDTRQCMHLAHVRMAWNHLRELQKDAATPLIKQVLQSHFKHNTHTNGHASGGAAKFHDTITSFYIHLIHLAVQAHKGEHQDDFFDFAAHFPDIMNPHTIESYYTKARLFSPKARQTFVLPDRKPLPVAMTPLKGASTPHNVSEPETESTT